MDWTEVLAAEDENPRSRLVTELLASPAYDSTAARVKAFVQQGGGCRATFFNYQRRLGAARRRSKALSVSADVSQGTKVTQQHGVHVRDRLQDDQAGARPGFSDFERPLR